MTFAEVRHVDYDIFSHKIITFCLSIILKQTRDFKKFNIYEATKTHRSHVAAAIFKALFGYVGFLTFMEDTREEVVNNLEPGEDIFDTKCAYPPNRPKIKGAGDVPCFFFNYPKSMYVILT